MKIGVLALQGAFKEHVDRLERLNISCVEIRKRSQLDDIDGLILPGGESTTIGKLLIELDIKEHLVDLIKNDMPVWGTCAGMILLAKDIGKEKPHINMMDIEVKRNGYGRQVGSFIKEDKMACLGEKPFPMVFIRAPYIKACYKNTEILHQIEDKIVAAKQNNMFVTSFHPEITDDLRCHEYFVSMVSNYIEHNR